jgi:ATP-binding cassette subfamily B protein
MLGGVLFRALEPWPLKVIFDHVILPTGDAPLGISVLESLSPAALLGASVLALVAVVGLRAASDYYSKVGFALAGSRIMAKVRASLYSHIHSLSLSFHAKARTGDLIVRMIGDIGMLRQVAITAFLPLVASLLVLVVMAGLMLWINWQLALLVLVTVPFYWLTSANLGRRIKSVSRKQRKREAAMASAATESLGAIESVQALSLEGTFADSFSSQNEKSLKDGVKARKLISRLQGMVRVMTGLSTALVLWVGVRQVLGGSLTPGELLVFLSYLKAAFRPIQDFSKYAGRIAKASASGDRVMEIMSLKPDIVDEPDAVEAPPLKGDIRFDRVTFSYEPAAPPVLRDFTLEIAAGETVALVGPSGIGKSTVLALVSRLYDPDDGRGQVLIDGVDIRKWTVDSLRSNICIVMQDSALFATSIAENIRLGSVEASDEDILEAARLANAHDFILAMPEGYASIVGERGVTLSAGQRQRIAIARASLRKTPILLLDEPTRGLDVESEGLVREALSRLAESRTTILVTHDMDHASMADRTVRMSEGAIVTPREWPRVLDPDPVV